MTTKEYYREITLHNLGLPASPKVLELHNYLEKKLNKLYISEPNHPIVDVYHKSKTKKIFIHNKENNTIGMKYINFTEGLTAIIDLYDFVDKIIIKIINTKYNLNAISIGSYYC